MNAHVEAFFDPATSTVSYVVYDAPGGACAIIDPVLDYEAGAGRTSTRSADAIVAFVRAHQLSVDWLLETHAHADHLSAAPYLKTTLGGLTAIGDGIRAVQATFGEVFNVVPRVGEQNHFDRLLTDQEDFAIGRLRARAWHVPGHTPADTAFVVDGVGAFVGDTLFMPDLGTARCDFPGGNAGQMYQSIRRLLTLDAETPLYLCHDYPPADRPACWVTSVRQQRAENIHVRDGIDEQDFVALRTRRDATLGMPALLLPAVQVNIQAGKLPAPDENGQRYLKIPLNRL